jgi:HAD superfamily hydrolase (TIGR01509 family)
MGYTIFKADLQTQPVRGILFDMDGVVLDTEALYARFWREAAAALGHSMSYEQALGMRSLSSTAGQAQLERYFGKGVSRAEFRAKRIELMDAYIDVHGVELKPGIRELLDYLDEKGIKAAITTSSPLERVERYLGPHGLLERFTHLCSGADMSRGKPEPDIYLHGAACLGLKPEACLAVEDSPAGVLSAYRAGCRTVMVPDLDQPDADTEKLLYAKADSLTDVIELIR